MSSPTPAPPPPSHDDAPSSPWHADALGKAAPLMRQLRHEVVAEPADGAHDGTEAITRIVLSAAAIAVRFDGDPRRIREFVDAFARVALAAVREPTLVDATVARAVGVVDAVCLVFGAAGFRAPPEVVVATLRAARELG